MPKVWIPISAPFALDGTGARITSITMKVIGDKEEDAADALFPPPRDAKDEAARDRWFKQRNQALIYASIAAYNQDCDKDTNALSGGTPLPYDPTRAHPISLWSKAATDELHEHFVSVNGALKVAVDKDFSGARVVAD